MENLTLYNQFFLAVVELLFYSFLSGDEQEVDILDFVETLDRGILYFMVKGTIGSSMVILPVLKVVLMSLLLLNSLPVPCYSLLCHCPL